MRAPSQSLDGITAFAVPNPSCSSQGSRIFRVWSFDESPHRTDHSAYFGWSTLIKPILSASATNTIPLATGAVNASFWCIPETGIGPPPWAQKGFLKCAVIVAAGQRYQIMRAILAELAAIDTRRGFGLTAEAPALPGPQRAFVAIGLRKVFMSPDEIPTY